ncbi:ABC transporter substrate-binding protein [Streptomyces sp. NPDC059104]|uniref:ABC transporter substrate-binding protein n=1 Tax=Streptomyces sp. NPDC059104 TaxID=3346729 RepID=UPI0036831F53
MSAKRPSRRTFMTTSLTFAGGVALTACTADPRGGGSGSAKVLLSHWYHAYGEPGTQEAVKRYAAQYTAENPDVAVKITWVAGEYETKLNSALLGTGAPDVFEIGDFRRQLVTNGYVTPLDDILGADSGLPADSLAPVTVDGRTYGIKKFDDVMMLYYRKSALAEAQVPLPRTFDDLARAADALTHGDRKGLFVGNDGIGDVGYLLLWSARGDLTDAHAKIAFTTPRATRAIAGIRRLHASKSLLRGFTTDWYDPGALVQGAAAMHWCGLWAMPAVTKELGDDYGVLPWPAIDSDGAPAVRVGAWYELVNAKGRHVEEAKKYVRWLWLKQDDLQRDFAVRYGFHVPARSAVVAGTPELTRKPAADAVAIGAAYGKSFPNTWSTATATAFAGAVNAMAQGADAAKALAPAATACQRDIDEQLARS